MTDLELDFAMLAMAAEPSISRKLHVFGAGFETYRVPFVPAVIPPFAFVARMFATGAQEPEKHHVKLVVINPEGEESVAHETNDMVVHPPKAGRDISYASVVFVISIKFLSEGKYAFGLDVDGKRLKTLPLWVEVAEDSPEE